MPKHCKNHDSGGLVGKNLGSIIRRWEFFMVARMWTVAATVTIFFP